MYRCRPVPTKNSTSARRRASNLPQLDLLDEPSLIEVNGIL